MSGFTTLDNLYERAQAWAETLSDDTPRPGSMGFVPSMDIQYSSKVAGVQTLTQAAINDHAWNQLCERLHVPAGWAGSEHCPDELRQYVVNFKLGRAKDDPWLVRLRGNGGGLTARAFLSDSYTIYDNLDAVTAVKDAVESQGLPVKVWRPEIGDHLRFYGIVEGIDFGAEHGAHGDHAWVGDPNHGAPPGDGGGAGGMHPAIYVSNSEVGDGRFRITGGLYRSWCSNGVIIGWQAEEVMAVAHRYLTKTRMAQYAAEAIATALRLTEAAAQRFLELQDTRHPTTRILGIMETWAQKYGITVASTEAWKALVGKADREVSLFEAINWASFAAGRLQDTAEREVMERMAGAMILPPNGKQNGTRE